MNCNIPPEIEDYLELVESGEPKVCEEQKALAAHIRKCFKAEKIIVDTARLEKFLKLEKYFPYKLFPWEKFLIALWDCCFREDGLPRWKTLFCMVGRGSGKDGFIAFDSFCCVSPYNPVKHYDVDICANNEDQAVTPCKDVAEVLENPKNEKTLKKFFYHTKQIIQGRENLGNIKGRTNNPKGRDGMRSGKTIFNEVHAYENYDNIKVFITGQGKVAEPRVGIFTSNGSVNDGPLDDYLGRANRILFEDEADNGFLPFVCKLDNREQVHDEANWFMANPSLAYMPSLLQEIKDEYTDWKENPEQNADFVTKRMGIRQTFSEISVTEYANLKNTNKPIDYDRLRGLPCTIGIDYAELSDWAAVNCHFLIGDERIDINHRWVCLQSKTLSRVKAPWKEWARKGLITLVDDVSIHPDLIGRWIYDKTLNYYVKGLAMDGFRWTLMSESLRSIGFDASNKEIVKLVRPSDIMKTEPVIQECFNRNLFTWGDDPVLRWAVNNTKRVRSSRSLGVDTGNFIYAKIEAKSRKTDPFMAVVASMTIEDKLKGQPIGEPLAVFNW